MRTLMSLVLIWTFLTSGTLSSQQVWKDPAQTVEERVEDLLKELTLEEKCAQMLYNSPAIDRLGIPAYNWWSEALHGVARMGRATVFPQPIGLAATFDTGLIFRLASAIGDEARIKYNAAIRIGNVTQYGGLSFWSPNINIFRDPRWGRGMETWGEDPYLTGTLGVQFVRGMQGSHPVYLKTAACAKHYVVHSGPEKIRHEFNALPPVKDFRETYLPAFERLVKEGRVEAVMCAYNRTYDEPCCGSVYLLQEILRNEWGFRGHIVSDCWAITDFNQFHKVTGTVEESAAMALHAGVNLNCGVAYKALPQAVRMQLITPDEIDRQLAPLLRTRFRLGLLDPPGSTPWDTLSPHLLCGPEHLAIAREAAAKSVVMLKNSGVLPLSTTAKRLIVTGPLAADVDVLLGNYNGVPAEAVTILEGIVSAVDAGTRISYHHGYLLNGEDSLAPKRVYFDVNNADATILVMGINPLWEGEEGEAIATPLGADKPGISLPSNQLDYLRELSKDRIKPLVAIVTGGSPLDLEEVYELADAVLFAWYPGEQGGHGIADVLFGRVSPSGRLPVTFPASAGQMPAFDNYSMEGRTYKYLPEEPLFPFGFGLSYSSFAYSDLRLSPSEPGPDQPLNISVRVTNTGTQEAAEVVQIYLTHTGLPFRMPSSELIRYTRVTLRPGSSLEVAFTLLPQELNVIDLTGASVRAAGEVIVTAGGSAPSSRATKLGAPVPVSESIRLMPQ